MNIKINYTKGTTPVIGKDLRFGTTFTDKMFEMDYEKDKGWFNPVVKKFEPFSLSPATLVLHYAQEIFEGQKAYKWKDGRVVMFRPENNIKRFNISATKMCMPNVDEKLFMEALETLVWADRDWIPQEEGQSLYIRAAMIATDPVLGVRSGSQYKFFIINSPIGCYFLEGFNPIKIWASDTYVRTVPGGVGEAKTGANYASSLRGAMEARERGCTQALWLDGQEKKYIEEISTMNVFFVENGKLITPKLTGGILHGITRDSVIVAARDLGYSVEERKVSITEFCEGVTSGKITEFFGCGTACVISPVGEIIYKDKSYVINNFKTGKITQHIYDTITGIQYGKIKDKFGWIKVIEPRE
ncbi:MAG: branched-chain amino acid aminotransferase [Proteobacteria bacterium]|nr:branched-chain amino acid aminotransferase [Pseudomonadota bacterium]